MEKLKKCMDTSLCAFGVATIIAAKAIFSFLSRRYYGNGAEERCTPDSHSTLECLPPQEPTNPPTPLESTTALSTTAKPTRATPTSVRSTSFASANVSSNNTASVSTPLMSAVPTTEALINLDTNKNNSGSDGTVAHSAGSTVGAPAEAGESDTDIGDDDETESGASSSSATSIEALRTIATQSATGVGISASRATNDVNTPAPVPSTNSVPVDVHPPQTGTPLAVAMASPTVSHNPAPAGIDQGIIQHDASPRLMWEGGFQCPVDQEWARPASGPFTAEPLFGWPFYSAAVPVANDGFAWPNDTTVHPPNADEGISGNVEAGNAHAGVYTGGYGQESASSQGIDGQAWYAAWAPGDNVYAGPSTQLLPPAHIVNGQGSVAPVQGLESAGATASQADSFMTIAYVERLFDVALGVVVRLRRMPFNVSHINCMMADIYETWNLRRTEFETFLELCEHVERRHATLSLASEDGAVRVVNAVAFSEDEYVGPRSAGRAARRAMTLREARRNMVQQAREELTVDWPWQMTL